MAETNQIKWVGIRPTSPEESIPTKKGAEERLSTANTPVAQVSIGTSTTQILAANANRVSFIIKNLGNEIVYIRFGANATLTDYPLGTKETIGSDDYKGRVDGIVASGSYTVVVIEV